MIKNSCILQKEWDERMNLYEKNYDEEFSLRLTRFGKEWALTKKTGKKFPTTFMMLTHIKPTQFYGTELPTLYERIVWIN